LPHRPELPAVHRRVDAARERIDARVARVLDADVLRGVEGLVLDTRDRREQLALALRRGLVELFPGLEVGGGTTIFGRRHRRAIVRMGKSRHAVDDGPRTRLAGAQAAENLL